MGPKAFITCYVCFREFGSRSIPFHEPKCLERWRSSNRNLPPEKRSPTPVKPVGWKNSIEPTWLCTNCQVSVPATKRGEHAGACFAKAAATATVTATTGSGNNSNAIRNNPEDKKKVVADDMAAGSTKKPESPKKGKDTKNGSSGKNDSTDVPVRNTTVTVTSVDSNNKRINHESKKGGPDSKKAHRNDTDEDKAQDEPTPGTEPEKVSTSNRSIRPQTKTLRRPTPNLKHPVIQVESDESSDNSEKAKEDENPKRMKHSSSSDGGGTSNGSTSAESRPKNFIMYNKYNVERNTKTSPKERSTIATKDIPQGSPNSIPFPCNSCSRSIAPERLHSHSRKDAAGLMLKKTPSITEPKTPSPQKKTPVTALEEKKPKGLKTPDPEKEKPCDSSDCASSDSGLGVGNKSEKIPSVPKTTTAPKKALNSLNICYLCGKDPSPSSLSLHESKCLERWKKENGLISPRRRKQVPDKPPVQQQQHHQQTEPTSEEMKTETKNDAGQKQSDPEPKKEDDAEKSDEVTKDATDPAWQVVQAQLVPCPSCGRTFFPERLPVHQRVCKGKVNGQGLNRAHSMRETATPYNNEDNGDKQSMYVPCYICGKNFGTWVIQMHESQCLRKWRRANEKLPPHLQQQEPHKPQLVLVEDQQPEEDDATDEAWESHLQQLVPCQRCGRTFFPDRLEVHGRSCKGPVAKQQTPRIGSSTNKTV